MSGDTKKNLSLFSFCNLTNWSVQYLLETSFSYSEKYPLVKIGSFLSRNKTPINIEDNKEYKRVTIKVNNGGVYLRDIEKGENIGTKKQFILSKGQFILSKIDARNGAFGVATEYVDGAVITGNFWAFDVDNSKINPYFLSLILTSKEFIRFSQNASNGTTNRHYLQENLFLEQEIPLPNLEEQNRIVDKYNQKVQLAEKQEQQAKDIEEEIEKYLYTILGIDRKKTDKIIKNKLNIFSFKNIKERWDVHINTLKVQSSLYNFIRFKDIVLKISTGTTPPSTIKEYFTGNINFYTPSDLGNIMYLTKSERFISQKAIDDNKARVFPKNTFLFVGIGSTIGKVGIVKNELASSNQQITGILIDSNKASLEFVYYYFDTFKSETTKEKTQSTIPILNQKGIENIQLPLPPLSKQNEIVNHIDKLRVQIKDLRLQATQNREQAISNFEKEIFS